MPIVDYRPNPAGGYTFRDDAGRSLHAFGPEAESMKSWIDQTRPPDRRLAYDPSAPFGSAESVPTGGQSGPPAPPPSRLDAGGSLMSEPTMSYAPEPNASVAPPAPPPPVQSSAPTPETPAATAEPGAERPVGTPGQQYFASRALQGKVVGGSAAVNPQTEARQFAWRQGQSVNSVDMTPEERAEYHADLKRQRVQLDAALAESDAAAVERTAAAEQRGTDALNQALQSDIEKRDAQQQLDHVQNVWNTTNANLQREQQAASNMKVDPDRLFHEKGTLSTILSGLGVALGAYGAAVTHSPNFAMQIVDAAIQRDIDAQTDAIHRKGEAAQNAIANFQRTYGMTLEESRLAVRMTAQQYAAARADMTAASIGSAEAKQQAAQFKAGMLQKDMKDRAELENLVRGRATTQYGFVQPRRATAGRRVALSDKEIAQAADTGAKLDKLAGVSKEPDERNAQLKEDQHNLERRVTLPDGKFAYATTKDRADTAQKRLDSAAQFRVNAQKQRDILSHMGSTMDPKMLGEYDALVQEQILLSKDNEDLGAIAKADQELVTPLTGMSGKDFFQMKDRTLAAIDSAVQHVDFRERQATKQLFSDEKASRAISPTEEGLGIKETKK